MIDPGYTPPPPFLCPLCGSNACLFVTYKSPAGKYARMPWFSCVGCTVMFLDPHRFQVMMRRTVTDGSEFQVTRVVEAPGIGEGDVPAWNRHRESVD